MTLRNIYKGQATIKMDKYNIFKRGGDKPIAMDLWSFRKKPINENVAQE